MGFAATSCGLILILRSGLGMGPWGALEVALSERTIFSMGQITQFISLILVILSWLMGISPSFVTIMNVYFIGLFMDLFLIIIPQFSNIFVQLVVFFSGLIIYSFGISFYLSFSKNNSGPRESFMLGLSKFFSVSIRLSRVMIDVSIFIIALFFRGPVGIGTLIFALSAGPLIQRFLKFRGLYSEKGEIKKISS